MIEKQIPLLDDILDGHAKRLGTSYEGYRNHVYRMVNFCLAQREFDDDERSKIVIAGCFHDIGIWTDETFDYLPPSIVQAERYLAGRGLEEWTPEITLMIDQHHKLTGFPMEPSPLIEVFRRGDLIDFSLGIFKCGITRAYIKAVRSHFPNAGFHRELVRQAGRWICRNPLNPVPVIKF